MASEDIIVAVIGAVGGIAGGWLGGRMSARGEIKKLKLERKFTLEDIDRAQTNERSARAAEMQAAGELLVDALHQPDRYGQNVNTAKEAVVKATSDLGGDPIFGKLAAELQQASRNEDVDTAVEVLNRLAEARSGS